MEDVVKLLKKQGDAVFLDDNLFLIKDINKLFFIESHHFDRIVVALCLKGTAKCSVDTEERVAHAGDLIVIQQGRTANNFSFSEDLNAIAIVGTTEIFDDMMKSIRELHNLFLFSRRHAVVSLTEDERNDIQTFFNIIIKRAQNSKNIFRKEFARSLVSTMMYIVCDAVNRSYNFNDMGQSRADEIFAKFITLVDKNCMHERRVGWYADELNITAKYLSEVVKLASKNTPNQWIDHYVILQMKHFLQNTTLPIKDITEKMRFPTQSFLGRFFKERVGVSPSEYRKSKQK